MEADADSELMLRVAKGDRGAFATLFDRYQPKVARFAYRFVRDAGRAEELTQDIFLKLYRGAGSYRPTARFQTFLFRVATNHCLNAVRRVESPAEDPHAAGPDPAGPLPEQLVWARQLEGAVGEALAALSPRERAAFTLCRFEGLSYREIAEALPASEAAVKSLIHRATLAVARRADALNAAESAPRREA